MVNICYNLGWAEMRLLAAIATASLALAAPKGALGAEPPTQQCTKLGALTVAAGANIPVEVVPCVTKTLAQPVVGNFSNYYGQVLLSTTGSGSYKVKNDFGQSIRKYFGIADKFDAVVSIELWKRGTLLYQRPLFTASVDDANGTTVSVNNVNASETEISPYFLLDTNTGSLQAKITVSVLNRRSGQVLETLKQGVDAAAALGGHGWLVTAFNTDQFVTAAAKAESTFYKSYSYSLSVGSETDIGFGDKAYKSIRYSVTIPSKDSDKPAAKVEATISLRTRLSLLTERTIANTLLPDMNKGAESPDSWANRIQLGGEQRLDKYIEEGTPRKLADLDVVDDETPDTEVLRRSQIDAACTSLKKAISESPVKLSDSDKLLVLFDELRRRKVFTVYRAADLSCTSGLVEDWKALKLVVPEPAGNVALPVPEQARKARMRLLGKSWRLNNADERSESIPDNFTGFPDSTSNSSNALEFKGIVRLTAPADFLPGMPSPASVDSRGYSTWDIDPKHLARLHNACFGNVKSMITGEPGATAFATFVGGEPVLYLIKAYFADDVSWGKEGPRIKSVSISEASDQDKIEYNHPEPGGCLGTQANAAALAAP